MNYKNKTRIIEFFRKLYPLFGYWYPVIDQKGHVVYVTGKIGSHEMTPAKILNFIEFIDRTIDSWHSFKHSHKIWK